MEAAVSICLLVGVACATLASSKRRSVIGWFVIGSVLPVIGLVLIVILPSPGFVMPAAETPHVVDATIVASRTHLQSTTLDAVARLVELRDRGGLTAHEFEERRSELLARI